MNHQNGKKIALILVITMVSMSLLPFATAFDTDGDGVEDHLDDCPVAEGNSTIDRTGCPDADGDGTSDRNDPWSIQNGGFAEDARQPSSNDYYRSKFSHDGNHYMTSDGNNLRIWDTATKQNIRTVSVSGLEDISWSPDDMYVGALDDQDQMSIYYANNITELFTISVDVGGGDQAKELEFSPDGTMIAVVIGRSGNSGTNGEVQIYDSSTGTEITSFTPGGDARFESVDWSPDGSRIAIGGDEDVWVYETATWTQNATRNTNRGNINSIAWSPDGNSIAVCEAWESSGARIRMLNYHSLTERWVYSTSTTCNDVEFSPDSTQVAAAHTYYSSDGASIRIFKTHDTSATIVDTLAAPRPGGCTSSGGSNNCGSIYGLDWHPNGMYIISAQGRNDEGIYHWSVDPDIDSDGVLNQDDAFPEDGTQWDDTDGDGFGDNPAPAFQPDSCLTVAGSSHEDRFGCPDSDGDGWSDEDSGWTVAEGADRFPSDGTQWIDTDGDGVGDNNLQGTHYTLTGNQLRVNQTGDAFPNDDTQWNDTDGDGWGDNFVNTSWVWIRPAEWPGDLVSVANVIDTFPLDRTQWMDTDGDWVGDNELSDRSDGCPNNWGDSEFDRLGCVDTDGDGWSDPDANWQARTDCYGADAFPNDPTQWCDEDNDGYGSNVSGNNADDCPNEAGTSTVDRVGCSDRDGDGYSNAGDPFPDDSSQWSDRDGDGRGDNPNGSNPDIFPDDTSQWKDTDGDGYGDNPGGFNGDQFSNDATQWADTDGDGFGDNLDGVEGDVCPLKSGQSTNPVTRGCPDTDLDGFTDPEDAFPDDPFQWADIDGDGFGDNQGVPSGDECVDVFGKSNKNNRHGCPDYDLDGWADVDDAFPEDHEQWMDTDGDGWGDNYFYENTTIEDLDYPGLLLVIREQRDDAFPEIADQWSDMDGDGWGDNATSFYQPDSFPLHPSQWNDFDGDGYGDEANYDPDGEEGPLPIIASWQPDGCRKEAGTSIGNPALDLDWGCPDSDNDGIQNAKDPCPWDPEISSGAFGQDCAIKSDPNINSDNSDGNSLAGNTKLLTMMGGSILFLLALIFVAQVSKAAGKKKLVRDRYEEKMANEAFAEEEERRQTWIEHYVNSGELDKARELGWNGLALPSKAQDDAVPQWKQHEIDQKTEQEAAIPSMMDLDRLL